jgi:hypothetical protein
MQTENLLLMLQGATAMGCVALAVFFLRFWVRSRDRLFAIFSGAFAVFAVNRVMLVTLPHTTETDVLIYGIRAVAFGLLMLAILDKNRLPPA